MNYEDVILSIAEEVIDESYPVNEQEDDNNRKSNLINKVKKAKERAKNDGAIKLLKSDGSKEGPMAKAHPIAKAIPIDNRPAQGGQIDDRHGVKVKWLSKNTPKTIEKKSDTKPEMASKKSTIGGQEDTKTSIQRKMANNKIINNGKDAYNKYPIL